MKRLVSFLFWTLLFLLLCLGIDQLLVRVEMPLPVLAEARTFYVDFRSRLLQLGHPSPAQGTAAVKRAAPGKAKAVETPPAASPAAKGSTPRPQPAPAAEARSPRYLYADKGGELHFADSLEEVPAAYRKDAQRLEK